MDYTFLQEDNTQTDKERGRKVRRRQAKEVGREGGKKEGVSQLNGGNLITLWRKIKAGGAKRSTECMVTILYRCLEKVLVIGTI